MTQRRSIATAFVLGGWMAVTGFGLSAAIPNPYTFVITNANPFGLKAPPTAEELAAKTPPPQLPPIYLTGLTTLMGGRSALLRVSRPARPPEPAKEIPLILAEGAPAEEGVEVLKVDIESGTVQVRYGGNVQTLDIRKNAPKSSGGGGPGMAAGPAPVMGGGIPMPKPGPGSGGGPATIGRPMRGQAPPQSQGTDQQTNNPGDVVDGVRTLGGGEMAFNPEAPKITPEEQQIMMEAERIKTKDAVEKGEMPPLPPTDLSEMMDEEQKTQQGGPPSPGGPPAPL